MTKKTKRIIQWCVGIYFGICLVYAIYSYFTEPNTTEPVAKETVVSEAVNPEDIGKAVSKILRPVSKTVSKMLSKWFQIIPSRSNKFHVIPS